MRATASSSEPGSDMGPVWQRSDIAGQLPTKVRRPDRDGPPALVQVGRRREVSGGPGGQAGVELSGRVGDALTEPSRPPGSASAPTDPKRHAHHRTPEARAA